MAKLKPCPIEGCQYKWLKLTGLGLHLYSVHLKSELVNHIVREEAKKQWIKRAESHV